MKNWWEHTHVCNGLNVFICVLFYKLSDNRMKKVFKNIKKKEEKENEKYVNIIELYKWQFSWHWVWQKKSEI